jgi:hypothetical protein
MRYTVDKEKRIINGLDYYIVKKLASDLFPITAFPAFQTVKTHKKHGIW